MRKVKVLAFVLAALMVVAAFAGCGTKQLKTDVSTLDERVTALETLLKQVSETVNGGATKDDITEILDAITANKAEAAAGDKTLADAIAKITADQATANAALKADLEKLVDAAKKDQAAGDAALQVAIEKLNNSIDATNKALADAVKDLEGDITAGDKATLDAVKELLDAQNKDIADALAKIEETIKKNQEAAGTNATLQAAINTYVGNLTVLKNQYDLEKAHYVAADYTAVSNALTVGIQNIQIATTVELAKASYDAALATVAKYERVDVALYNAIQALVNKVDGDSKKAVENLEKQLENAQKHYDGDELVKYLGDKNTNLETEVKRVRAAYNAVAQLLKDIEALNKAAKAIDAVRLHDVNVDGKTDVKTGNSAAIVANKTELTRLTKYITSTKADEVGKYLSDALVDKITYADQIVANADTIQALTVAKAQLSTYGDINANGGFDKIFVDYNALENCTWFDKEAVYADVNEKINAWLADYPVVDAANAEAIINVVEGASNLAFYDTYKANEKLMNLFADAYDEFVADFVPTIKELNVMKKVTTDNVKTYAELVTAIDDWKVVVKDNTATKDVDEKILIDDNQFKAMLKKALGRETIFDWKDAGAGVADFFNTTVKEAEAAAKAINDQIKALAKVDETALSVLPYKELDGYELTGTNQWKRTKTAGTIYGFTKTYKTDNYDLTYLLKLDDFNASLDKVTAKIASIKVLADAVKNDYNTIKNALKDKDLAKVSLDNEAAVKNLKADYEALTAIGFRPATTVVWESAIGADKKPIKDTYAVNLLLTSDVYMGVTDLIETVEALREYAKDIVAYVDLIKKADDIAAFTVKKIDENKAIYKYTETTDSKGNVTKAWESIGTYSVGATTFSWTVDKSTKGADAMSQITALEGAYKAYAAFTTYNQGKTDASVEAAMASIADLKFIAIKALAYNTVDAVAEPTNWSTAKYGEFKVQKNIQLVAIENAAAVALVADILDGFHEMLLSDYAAAVEFAGVTYFHADGTLHAAKDCACGK